MSGNTYRGTPTRNQGRAPAPFGNSPGGSSIPRPVLETTQAETSSSLSASRQKQSKRDEVRYCIYRILFSNTLPWPIQWHHGISEPVFEALPLRTSSRVAGPKYTSLHRNLHLHLRSLTSYIGDPEKARE